MSLVMWVVVMPTAAVTGQTLIADNNQGHTSTATHAITSRTAVCRGTVLRAVCGASEY